MEAMIVLGMVQWGFLTAVIARGKRRNAALWFAVGAALPVAGVILALVVGVRERAPLHRKLRAPPREQATPSEHQHASKAALRRSFRTTA